MEQLYIEVLYTIKYKVGSSGGQTSQYQEELYAYAQKAFKVSNDMHRRYLSIASEEKVSLEYNECHIFILELIGNTAGVVISYVSLSVLVPQLFFVFFSFFSRFSGFFRKPIRTSNR